jgi:hypothetical protein
MRHCAALLLCLAGCQAATQSDPNAEARAAVLAALKDPESARFGPMTAGKPGTVCGTVNARNSFGGYTGNRAFAWTSGKSVLIYSDPPDWGDKGNEARRFAAVGCSIGPDHKQAIEARDALDASQRRVSAI